MRRYLYIIVLAVSLCPLLAEAVTRDVFLVRTTQDYVALCSTNPSDPLYAAAMGFCHGYGVGAFHDYLATTADTGQTEFVCLPDPPPARAEILQMFVAWAREHPQYMGERPVDSVFRFLADTWACRR